MSSFCLPLPPAQRDNIQYGTLGHFKLNNMDFTLFGQVVTDFFSQPAKTLAAAKVAPTNSPTHHNLVDQATHEIIRALQTGFQVAAKKPTGRACGYLW